MSIQYAILGLLSWRPFAGYDLKKVFAESEVFYWSGNNNQIYKALVQLHTDGLVTQETRYQENLPPKKTYTITPAGEAALKQWVLSAPELPEFRSTFLTQLAWADLLTEDELDALLARYEAEIQAQYLLQQEQARRKEHAPSRTPRESFLWEMISENVVSVYRNELAWVRKVREGLRSREQRIEIRE
jgi:DNA-binding PadR family transcriptional regulator